MKGKLWGWTLLKTKGITISGQFWVTKHDWVMKENERFLECIETRKCLPSVLSFAKSKIQSCNCNLKQLRYENIFIMQSFKVI